MSCLFLEERYQLFVFGPRQRHSRSVPLEFLLSSAPPSIKLRTYRIGANIERFSPKVIPLLFTRLSSVGIEEFVPSLSGQNYPELSMTKVLQICLSSLLSSASSLGTFVDGKFLNQPGVDFLAVSAASHIAKHIEPVASV